MFCITLMRSKGETKSLCSSVFLVSAESRSPALRPSGESIGPQEQNHLPVSINIPVLGTLCLQPKLILCFWVFTLFPWSSFWMILFFFLTDEGGPGNRAAVCLWKRRKKSIKHIQDFHLWIVLMCFFFLQIVSVIYFLLKEIPRCAI